MNKSKQTADPILNLEVTVSFVIESAISEKELKREFRGDALRYARYLLNEEGVAGLIEDYTVIKARTERSL